MQEGLEMSLGLGWPRELGAMGGELCWEASAPEQKPGPLSIPPTRAAGHVRSSPATIDPASLGLNCLC